MGYLLAAELVDWKASRLVALMAAMWAASWAAESAALRASAKAGSRAGVKVVPMDNRFAVEPGTLADWLVVQLAQ